MGCAPGGAYWVSGRGMIGATARCCAQDGASYMGPMKNGCPNGEGVVLDASQTRFRVVFDGTRQEERRQR